MKKLINTLPILLIFLTFFTCDDILEKDITSETIQIISPVEGVTITGNTVQFSWQELEGADHYRIQILKQNHVYELDSLVSTTTFVYPLNTGNYQWRIRGENFAYETVYTFPIAFSVEESEDLSNQSVVLKTPSENFYTNGQSVVFTWNALGTADSYAFELIKKLNGEQTVFQQSDIAGTSVSLDATTINEDAQYLWKVKGVNATTETPFSERSFYIDRVVPNQPSLSEPTDQKTIAISNVTFNWTNGTDTGTIKSTITNYLQIATDIDFNAIIHTANTSNNSLQYNFTTVDTYYWRVRSIDASNNQSDYSAVRSIIVQ